MLLWVHADGINGKDALIDPLRCALVDAHAMVLAMALESCVIVLLIGIAPHPRGSPFRRGQREAEVVVEDGQASDLTFD